MWFSDFKTLETFKNCLRNKFCLRNKQHNVDRKHNVSVTMFPQVDEQGTIDGEDNFSVTFPSLCRA